MSRVDLRPGSRRYAGRGTATTPLTLKQSRAIPREHARLARRPARRTHQPRRQRNRRALALAQRKPPPSRQRFAPSPAARLPPDPARCSINAAEHEYGGLKEQAIHGRIFRTIDEVRAAVREFVARYNAEWLVEKNGYRSPAQMRATWQEETFRRAA